MKCPAVLVRKLVSVEALPVRGLVLAAALLLAGCGGNSNGIPSPTPSPTPTPSTLALTSFVTGLASPLGLETPSDGTNRLFAVEQGGTIHIIQNGALISTPFLDIHAKLESGGEKGLLGLAFHPQYSSNGRFFVNYTRRVSTQLQTVIAEYGVSSNPNVAAASERILLLIDQPFDNHNGGQLAFGPDGFLYIGVGDGGSEGDPSGNGQNKNTLLGKILRIDVDGAFAPGKQYAIPADNPFAAGGGLPEIYAYGFRNPWRFSFDSNRLFVADVGQDSFEEIDLVTKGNNYGWKIMEATHCYPPGSTCNMSGLTLPITEYPHDSTGGSAVIGGFVYRGSSIPNLVGAYVFGDLSSGNVWTLIQDQSGNWQRTLVLTHNRTVSSFGRDSAGELYLLDYGAGAVLHVVAAP